VSIRCPECGHTYEAWHRPSVNLDLDPQLADPDYLYDVTHARCPNCSFEVAVGGLIVRGDLREMR
jgi:CpXC protein